MRLSVSCDPRAEVGLTDWALSRASRDASLRVTFVVVVVVSACGSSSLFHFLYRLARGSIVAENEIVVCSLTSRPWMMVPRKWLAQQS